MRNTRIAPINADAPPRTTTTTVTFVKHWTKNQRFMESKKMKLNEDEVEREKDIEASVANQPPTAAADDNKAETVIEDAKTKPLGDVVRVSVRGGERRNHYEAFQCNGIRYDLDDPVLLVPEDPNQKPYVAIIKDITQTKDGSMIVTGQRFYSPEEAEKRGGGNWHSHDTRELFYTFHHQEVPAEFVIHNCLEHFIPSNKEIPKRKQHFEFIVQKVYDTEQKRLLELTDKDYKDNKQHEIDLLIQKTLSQLGDPPDVETEETAAVQEDKVKKKRILRRRNDSIEATTDSRQPLKAETPRNISSDDSEYHRILANFKVLSGETHRDKWLEKLLQEIQSVCSPMDNRQSDDKEKVESHGIDHASYGDHSKSINDSQEMILKHDKSSLWPDAAVSAVTALEKASHDALFSDFPKYNQKMRQLTFNLKKNEILAQRLLSGKLEPSKIVRMSPNELKEGLMAEEMERNEPDELEHMQMTDASCKRCMEKKVGIIDIIHSGRGDRYQLECIACGNTWYAFNDEASALTIEEPSSVKNVGTAPLATAKFEDIKKKKLNPDESEGSADDLFKKTTEAYMPVLNT